MTKAEEIRVQLDSLRDQYQADYQKLADALVLAQWGAEVGAVLVNDDAEQFVVQEMRYSDRNARVRKLTGILSRKAEIELDPDGINHMGWRRKDEN